MCRKILFICASLVVGGLFLQTQPVHAAGIEILSTPLYGKSYLTAYYRLEDVATGTDSKGSNNATYSDITATSGAFGGTGMHFDGTDASYIAAPNGVFNWGNNWSVSMWFKFDSTNTYDVMLGESNSSVNPVVSIYYDTINDWIRCDYAYGKYVYYAWTPDTNWHLLVITASSSGPYAGHDLYLDGVSHYSIGDTSATNNGSSAIGLGNFIAGNSIRSGNDYTGSLDDVAFFSQALTSDQISDLYNNSFGPSFNSLNQYKLDEATPIADGATTTESSVSFGATLNSSGTSTLQLQVEVQPTGTDFTGTPNASSSFVSPGDSATAVWISGTSSDVYPRFPETSSDGQFHWQARVFDGTNYSDWQTFGADSTSTVDFTINTAPIYTQIGSPYPSEASTTGTEGGWAYDQYDDGSFYCGGFNTIGGCGCAISTVAMWLQYYGITTDASGTAVDPRNLNTWLTNHGGYDAGGDLIWDSIQDYASSSYNPVITYKADLSATGTFETLSSTTNSLLSSTTPDPVILFEKNAPEGTTTGQHFLLAFATTTNYGTSTYEVRDSDWYLTQYLNQASSTHVNDYSNTIDGIEVYEDPPQAPFVDEYDVSLPDSLMLIDSQGRRTGKDPITGTWYHEIPNTVYQEIGKSGQLIISSPSDNSYKLYVLGGKTGSYWLDERAVGGSLKIIRGNIKVASMLQYHRSYDKNNEANSSFSFVDSSSSTASIVSASPHNLPPPQFPKPITKPVVNTQSLLPVIQIKLQPSTTTTSTSQ